MSTPSADLPKPAAVIFDLDGTLVDTVDARIQAWQMTFAEEGIRADRAQVAELIGSDGRRLAREVAAATGVTLAPGRDETIDARSGEIFTTLNADPQVLPGVHELIARIEALPLRWAIATSSRRDQVAASIAALRLPAPPLVIDGTHVQHAKPAPDLLLLAAGELGAPPERCWYIGDATWDMLAAGAAGMVAIAVTSGAADASVLRAAGARHVVESLSEIRI